MNEIIENTKKLNLVSMYQAEISTEDKPIIGTDALATCIGVLLYNETNKQAIVAHVAPDQIDIVDKILSLMLENNWHPSQIKYKIISGYYEEHYNTKQRLEEILGIFTPFEESEIPDNAILINDALPCHSFAFDSRTGKFATDKVLFGEAYCQLYQELSPKKKK